MNRWDCRSIRGMGLIAAIALMTIIALGIGLAAPVVFQVIASDNTINTTNDLQSLKAAIGGNPHLLIQGERADFGFIGTMGNVPTQLAQLWIAASQPAYAF